MKRIISLFMSILIILTCAPITLAADGDGSAINPYLIRNAQELMNINNDLDAHYKLANNIDLSYLNFTPIGNADGGAFTGVFDGAGYTISGLSIYDKPKYCGLFGYCNGEVKNLNLTKVHMEGGRFTGGIAGFLDLDGVITNCTVSGKIYAEGIVNSAAAGGITGYCTGEIKDCNNKADVTSTVRSDYDCDIISGGITGILDSEKAVTGCVNNGNITTDIYQLTPTIWWRALTHHYTGGIAGKAENISEFSDCVNNGNIFFLKAHYTQDHYPSFDIGGMVGSAFKAEMYNCINNGDLHYTGDYYSSGTTGGMSGSCESGTFDGCKNFGEIQGADYSGGIAGRIGVDGNFYKCINSGYLYSDQFYLGGIGGHIGKVTAENCYNYSDITSNGGVVGGIISFCQNGGNISECANLGNIYSGYSHGSQLAGILFSYEYSSVIIDKCYNHSDIHALYKPKNGYPSTQILYGIGGNSATDCYSIGNIFNMSDSDDGSSYAISSSESKTGKDNYFVGSMLSYSCSGNLPFSFADVDYISEDTYVNKKTEYPEKLSDLQMQNKDSFVGWDFDDTWVIDSAVNSGYPILRCFYGDFILNESKATIKKGSTLQLEAFDNHSPVSPDYYESNDKTVATVSKNGLITAIGRGNCVISAYLKDGRRANCIVYVTDEGVTQKVADLTINKSRYSWEGFSAKLSEGEYIINICSEDESIAVIEDYRSARFYIRGVESGKVTVSAVTNFGNTFICDVTVTSLAETIAVYSTSVNVGEQTKLNYTINPSGTQTKVFFTSSDENVVTVDENGVLTGVSAGVAIVTVETDNGLKQSATVTVYAPIKSLTLERSSFTMTKGFTDKIIPVTDPVNHTDTLSYESSNNCVRVSADGVITAVYTGTAVITVTASSGKKAYCSVTVENAKIPVTGVSLDHSEVTLNPGEITELIATVHPYDATHKSVRWSVANPEIATVSQTGVVKAVGAGETTVRVTTSDGGYIAQCKVNVVIDVEGVALNRSRIALRAGESFSLSATTLPESATNKNVTWSSDNEDIASVDENGTVVANAIGKTIVSAESEDGNYTAECLVNVATDTYEVTWRVDDWTMTENYAYNEKIVEPEITEKQGYHFTGWSAEVPEAMPAYDMIFSGDYELHKLISFGENKASTCTREGTTMGEKCSVCSMVTIEQKTFPKLDHTEITVKGKAATCTATGLTDGKKCSVCGTVTVEQKAIAKLAHKETTVKGKAATCTATGLTDGKTCSVCGTVTVEQKAIAKKAHTYKTTTTKATPTKNGKTVKKCSVCSCVSSTTTIYYPKTIKLSATSYTYNGKEKTPTVIVKDSKGKTLKKNTDYTVKYSSGRKSIGKYTVTVTFKGNYSGTKKLTFEIVPAKVTLSKLTAGSKTLTATWKTVSGVTGYEVQYSTSSKFTSKTTKTVKIKSSKTKKTTIKKLTKGQKYYVRIRAYKTVNKKPVYGAWSAVKNVKAK